jgi:hypothetical protein
MRKLLCISCVLIGCTEEKSPVYSEPLFEGPFVYDAQYDGQFYIDTLWIVTQEAKEEIAALNETPEGYLDWRIDAMNETLERSLIDTSIVRSLGVHMINDHDIERTGVDIGDTEVTISNALSWLGSFRDVYGADKVMIVAGTEEGASEAALGGGDVSAHWVTFLPIEHEFGHQMGASHCNEGLVDELNYGYPASGYTEEGFPIENGPVNAGTRMCGNSIALFSNPDVQLSIEEIDDMISAGLAPQGDWEALINDDGLVPFGDAQYANMAQQWRDVEEESARKVSSTMYDGAAGDSYDLDDCIGLYAEEGYGTLLQEICVGEIETEIEDFTSVRVGSNVHTNLYTDPEFGASSMCGGQLLKLAYSSPSLRALSDHQRVPSISGAVQAISVYEPSDRDAHMQMDGPYSFYGAGTQPSCEGFDEQELVLMPDNRDWTATASVYAEPVSIPFAVDFKVRTFHENEDPYADGFTFFFGKRSDTYLNTVPPREQLGFVADGVGYGLMINTWTGNVGLRDGNWGTLGTDKGHNSNTNGDWVPVRVVLLCFGMR